MSGTNKKSERDRDPNDDDLLLRALRQLADEALEEEIPERLLRPLREAQAAPDKAGGGGSGDASTAPPPGRRRRGSGRS